MDDDFDNLLDEIEGKYCAKPQVSAHKQPLSDLDDIIGDLLQDDKDPESMPTKISMSKVSPVEHDQRKCQVVLLGGTTISMGWNHRTQEQRVCNKLRCTSCDFYVIWFNDYHWDTQVDYLFFRNNFPNFDKLKIKLKWCQGIWNVLHEFIKRLFPGSRAYSCQCSWQSVKECFVVSSISGLKWVCGKHDVNNR